jgi:class 3 adenylate cyclase/tetratricopeptide (TPR) repeat protein
VAAAENVTVLFTDLVGSTELASALTPEAGDEVRRKHFSALRRAIAASGGTEVKNLGDGLMVVFPASSSALSCAVAMQQAVHRDNVGADRPLGLRVGLSAGEATRETDDYFGDPVVEAARLCARAGAGQILAADLVRATAGRRAQHVFSSLGALELRGLPDPVETLEVTWEPLGDVDLATYVLPLPSRLEIEPTVGVIGRHAEVTLLADAFKRIANGEAREVVFVAGEAGVGKTTLATQVARVSFEAGAAVLLGRCNEDLGAPYEPFVEAISHFVTHATEDALRTHVEAHGGELAKIVPALRQRLGELPSPQSADPETERYLLYGAVVGVLAQMSGNSPVVLILDDLQWADKPSLQLLRHVVANTTAMPLLIVGTHRDSDLSAAHPLTETLATLWRESGVSRIELTGLDDAGVLAFLEAAAGHHLDEAGVGLAHAVYRETDGNPFFVGEVLLQLTETGAIYQDETGRWAATDDLDAMGLPESVRQVIGSRVARLGEVANHVLPLASVIGRDFDLELLARVTERSEDELLDVLDAAKVAALVRELNASPGRYSFSHALIQHTLYQDLGPTKRARAHRTVAEALEAICGNHPGDRVGELARHWFSATKPADAAKTISYARQAADAALAALAPDEAVSWLSRAFEIHSHQLDPDDTERCDILLALGHSLWQKGQPTLARARFLEAADTARRLGDVHRLGGAALGYSGAGYRFSPQETGAVEGNVVGLLREATAALGDERSDLTVRLYSATAQELYYDVGMYDEREHLSGEAVSLSRSLDDPTTLAMALGTRHAILRNPAHPHERLDIAGEMIAIARRIDNQYLELHARRQLLDDLVELGDFTAADREADALAESPSGRRVPLFDWTVVSYRGLRAVMVGDFTEGERRITEAATIGENTVDTVGTDFGLQLGMLRRTQGRCAEIISGVQELVDQYPRLLAWRSGLALFLAETDRLDACRTEFESLAIDGFSRIPQDNVYLAALACASETCAQLGDVSRAAQLFELLLPYEDLAVTISHLFYAGSVSYYLGILATTTGSFDEAARRLNDALAVYRRIEARPFTCYAQFAIAQMLRARQARGDDESANAMLVTVKDDSARLGMSRIAERTRHLLGRGA